MSVIVKDTKSKATHKPVEIVDIEEVREILEQVRGTLSEEQHHKLELTVETLAYVTDEIAEKNTTIRHLRKLLFGSGSEKTRDVLKEDPDVKEAEDRGREKKKPRGHGRNGAEK